MRKQIFKQLVLKLINKDVYNTCYDKNEVLYIHIPKAAGTSICKALYESDPWHYSSNELKIINPTKYYKYKKVGFVRNPLDRIASTYKYSRKYIEENPNTSISFMKNIGTLEEFIQIHLTKELVRNHYFFWTQDRYIGSDCDFVGKFENIEEDFLKMCKFLDLDLMLEHVNKSQRTSESHLKISHDSVRKVYELYELDYKKFNYPMLSNNVIVK